MEKILDELSLTSESEKEKLTETNKTNPNKNNQKNLNRNMFNFDYVIGKGGFGKVWRIEEKKTHEAYALKEMSKTKIIDKKSEKSINGEREFLSYLHHPFIVNMHYAFQDNDNLYLVMDLLTGGDLRYHCSRYRSFSEEQTRFFISCIVHSLSYIHENNVIHRDIKPENLVLDENGYLRITDFGIAKINTIDNSSETSGTPGYMSPEVMYGKNHSFPADFFAIGIIGYEFMMGKRPYKGRSRKEIKEHMLSYQAKIEKEDIKEGWSSEYVDFINKLLQRKENKRLGYKKGIIELKEHPWLKYYPWDELCDKSLPAPFLPENCDNFDKSYCESEEQISEETNLRYEEILLKMHYKTAFKNFYYNKNDKKEIKIKKIEINKESKSKTTSDERFKLVDSSVQINMQNNLEEKKNNNIMDICIDENLFINKTSEREKKIDNNFINNSGNNNVSNIKNSVKLLNPKNIIRKENISQDKTFNYNIQNYDKMINKIHLIKINNSSVKNTDQLKKTNLYNINNNGFYNYPIINPLYNKNIFKDPNSNFVQTALKEKSFLFSKKTNDKNNNKNKNNLIDQNKEISNYYFANKPLMNLNNDISLNLFNKMINNHISKKKKNLSERKTMKELIIKQKQLLISKSNKRNYIFEANNKINKLIKMKNSSEKNKMIRSNSVGMMGSTNVNKEGYLERLRNYDYNVNKNLSEYINVLNYNKVNNTKNNFNQKIF